MPFDYIALDTSALRAAGWPDVSDDLESLLRLARLSKSVVCLPQSVLLELEDFWRNVHQERSNKAQMALVKLEEVVKNADVLKQLQIPDVEGQLSDSVQKAEMVIGKWGIQVAPITSRPVEHFFKMAARKEAPFRKDGVGFKDAVIFFSLIDYLTGRRGCGTGGRVRLGFIASDSDFAHESLINAASDSGVELLLVKSIQEMNESMTSSLEDRGKAMFAQDRAQALDALEQMRPKIERMLNTELDIPASELFSVGPAETLDLNGVDLLTIDSVWTSFNPLLSNLSTPTKITADINIAIRLSVTRRVSSEQAPLRVGEKWSQSLDLVARMAATKIETTEEALSKVAKIEAVGVKTPAGYRDLTQMSVRLSKKSPIYGD